MMEQATPMKTMGASQDKTEQSSSLNEKQPLSSEQSPLPLVKESNRSKNSVNGDMPCHNAAEQCGPVGSTPLSPEMPQPNLEPANQTEKSSQRSLRTRSLGKKEGGPDLPVVSALAADIALPFKRRGRQRKSEEPISQSLDALASGETATGKESSGNAVREKRIRRPNIGKTVFSSPTGSQLTGEGNSTVNRKSLVSPIIIADVTEAGPDLTAEVHSTKKRRLSKLPTVRKKIHSPKAKSMTNNIEASGQKDARGSNGPSAGENAPNKAETLVTEETPLTDGSKSSTHVKKRGKPRKLPVQSTVSPEGKQITLFIAGQSETHETQPHEGIEVTEDPSLKGRDVGGHRITPRKRRGRPFKFKIGSKCDLSHAGASVSESDDQPLSKLFGRLNCKNSRHSSVGDEAGESQKKTDKETPTSKAEESQKKTSKGTPKSKAVIEWNGSSLFIKSSPIWKALQEMEVFKKFPQNPHFHPLEGLKESCREGLAIGNMVTFANVVDKSFKLKFSDSVGSISACLETLLELESYGFDVTPIHQHLKKLLSVKEGQEKLHERKQQVENQIVDRTNEKVQIDEQIVELNKEMKRLEEELAAANSRKEEKSLEIGKLKVKLSSIAEQIDRASSMDVEDV